MKKLFLFTDQYPFGYGEKPFLEPELKELARVYDVTIVSQGKGESREHDECLGALSSIRIEHYLRPAAPLLFLRSLALPFSKTGRSELRHLCADGFSPSRLMYACLEYARATSFRSFCKKRGIFAHPKEAVFYTFWFNNQALAISMEKRANPSIKWISRIHGYDLYSERAPFARQPFQKVMKGNVDHLLFLSDDAEEYFTEHFGPSVESDQYIQLGLGVPNCGNQPLGKRGDVFRIVSCSNMIPLKRVHLIAEALDALNFPDVEWVHFGDGDTRESIESYCEENGVNAVFFGQTAHSQVIDYYSNNHVDAFITTSSTEGMPVSIEEALSFGIPIIATDVGGIHEQIDGNGVLLSSNPTVEEIAAAIKGIYFSSEEDVNRMRQQSIQIWANRFDSERLRAELIRLLDVLGTDS